MTSFDKSDRIFYGIENLLEIYQTSPLLDPEWLEFVHQLVSLKPLTPRSLSTCETSKLNTHQSSIPGVDNKHHEFDHQTLQSHAENTKNYENNHQKYLHEDPSSLGLWNMNSVEICRYDGRKPIPSKKIHHPQNENNDLDKSHPPKSINDDTSLPESPKHEPTQDNQTEKSEDYSSPVFNETMIDTPLPVPMSNHTQPEPYKSPKKKESTFAFSKTKIKPPTTLVQPNPLQNSEKQNKPKHKSQSPSKPKVVVKPQPTTTKNFIRSEPKTPKVDIITHSSVPPPIPKHEKISVASVEDYPLLDQQKDTEIINFNEILKIQEDQHSREIEKNRKSQKPVIVQESQNLVDSWSSQNDSEIPDFNKIMKEQERNRNAKVKNNFKSLIKSHDNKGYKADSFWDSSIQKANQQKN